MDNAHGVRVRAKSGLVTTIDVPESGREVRVIIELTVRPLLERRAQGRQYRAEAAEVDRVHAGLAADVARIQGELAGRSGMRSLALSKPLRFEYRIAFSGASAVVDRDALPAIAALPYVKAVHRDRKVYARLQTSVPQIHAPEVWQELGARGQGVVVAIVDTGIDYTHPALGEGFGGGHRVIGGYDFINDDDDPMDDHGHGTHVAGIVAGNAAPVVAVAPEASLLAYKVLDDNGSGEDSGLLAAIEKLLDPDGNGDFSDRADVVNMSLGKVAQGEDDPVVEAVERATAAGVVFAIAAGNQGTNFGIGSPGIAPSVITVGASDANDDMAFFSSQGPVANSWAIKPEVTAPGVDIVSAALGGGTLDASGTSMASPHVAGVAALLRQLHPEWTPAEVKAAIVSTAKPLDSILAAGAGRVDALAAVHAGILPSPTTLSFGITGSAPVARTLRLTNRGAAGKNVTLGAFQPPDGVTVKIVPASVTIDSGQSVEVTVTITPGILPPSPNDNGFGLTGRVSITTSAGTTYVPWLLITGNLVAATYTGSDPALVLLARDGYLLAQGFRTAAATTYPGKIDVVMVTMPEEGRPRIIVRENFAVSGVTVAGIPPEEATLELNVDGRDEHGVPLASLGKMSNGGRWVRGVELFLPSALEVSIDSDLSDAWRAGEQPFVSPMPTTLVRIAEAEVRSQWVVDRYVHTAHLGVHRPLEGIRQNETLTFTPDDWVTQRFVSPCATQCDNSLLLAAGRYGMLGMPFGWTRTSGTVSLTRGGGERAPWFSLAIREADHPQVAYTKGDSVISPQFHVEDGVMKLRAWPQAFAADSASSAIDYAPPAGEPVAYGYGPTALRTIMGMRWTADQSGTGRDEWSITATPMGPLGEDLADDALRLQITMYDADGKANPGVRWFADHFVLEQPLAPGRNRLEIIDEYRIGDGRGRGTLTSQIDTLTGASAPTFTSLRVLDGRGRSVTEVGGGTSPTLQFSARQSTYFLGNETGHSEIDGAATRVWWRSHGSSEWRPLEVTVAGLEYGPLADAGTIYRASLRTIAATVTGAIDLKFALGNPAGATTEWVMEPAFFVTPARRRAVSPP